MKQSDKAMSSPASVRQPLRGGLLYFRVGMGYYTNVPRIWCVSINVQTTQVYILLINYGRLI